MTDFGYSVDVAEGYDEAVVRTRIALRSEGFGVLTEMHVGESLGRPENERQYLIMGVWNSAVSQRRIDSDLQVAVHLPCNVVVQETPGGALVAVTDPNDVIDTTLPEAQAVASAALEAIERMLKRVEDPQWQG